MKKLIIGTLASLTIGTAVAMPTKQELTKARQLVVELMAPTMAEYKAKTKTAIDVANTSISFAESARNEATRFVFLRGAVGFFIKGGEYGKAADTVERIKSKIANVPPAEIANIISSALGREDMRKAPRLHAQFQLAQTQIRAARDAENLKASLRQISTDPMRRQYAEAIAIGDDWNTALTEFAKVAGTVGNMAKRERNGTAKTVDLGDFWWSYEPIYTGGNQVFKEHAANYYRKAIAEGQIDGLKKTLVEQRLASLALPDVATAPSPSQNDSSATDVAARSVSTKQPPVGTHIPRGRNNSSGLVHHWSFADGFADSVGNVAPSKSDNATVENGAVSLRSGSPLEFSAGTVPLAPFTIQVWASATDKGLGAEGSAIIKIASSSEGKDDSVYWHWTNGGKKWVSRIGAFDTGKAVGHGKMLIDGKMHLYTVTGEKSGNGLALKFYQDDTCFGELTTKSAWKKPPMLILGGFVTPTYDEVRIYSRALSLADIINSLNLGPDKLPEGK